MVRKIRDRRLGFGNNKKGVELTLETIAVFIILLVVFIVIVYFFTTHYSSNSDALINAGNDALNNARSGN